MAHLVRLECGLGRRPFQAPVVNAFLKWECAEMKILLAEDDPTIRKLYGQVLESCGHTVIPARDGREALNRIAEGIM